MSKPSKTSSALEERAFVGCALLQPELLELASAKLAGSDFSDPQLGRLYTVMVDRYEAGFPSDAISIQPDATKIFDNPSHEIAELFSIPRKEVESVPYYIDQIADASNRVKLDAILADAKARVLNPDDSVDSIVEEIESRVKAIRQTGFESVTAFDAGLELIEGLRNPDDRRPIMTGMDDIDRTSGGILPGEFIVLAAKTGVGKTFLGMQIAEASASKRQPILFISLEMTRTELVSRMLCGMTEQDNRDIRRGRVSEAMTEKIDEANRQLEGVPFSIMDPPTATMAQIRAMARVQKSRTGLELLVVDYIGLVKARDPRIPRHEQVAEITGALKALAKELGIVVLALCQLNRQADKSKLPEISQLRESGSIEHDADIILLIHRDQDERNNCKLIIGKHRHGETGAFDMVFNPRSTRFETHNRFTEFDAFSSPDVY